MSTPILKTYVDERGNISVRVSHDVQVLTREEANRIEAEYKRMQADNTKLRELVADMWNEGMCECGSRGKCASCEYDYPTRMRELGIEVDG
ncbi:MAG: hypothetical protein U0K60_09675 [Parafannyhessea umbonata]|nr:hypothetical protein [Parafannyhessea umbonata]